MCAHYIRMGRMCRQKCSIHSLSGTLGRGGGGGFKYTLMSVWKGGGTLP